MTTDTDFSTARIEAPEGVQTVSITRDFQAPPEKVFRAHVDPELFMKWNGPAEITNTVRAWDPTTGGNWSYVSTDDNGEYGFFGSFHDVRENERIVQTFTYEGFPDAVSLEILTLTDLGDGRTRLSLTAIFDSVESRDGMVASGMETGIVEGYDKLDALLAEAE
ncbi:SRPBCC family protein [Brevibacterium casei]|uniref:SRPBCC family protein n=1 Tax=Brevibacterium casei TaxID=33889 RepID=A0A7T4A0R8_9MICO|nr:SRPBCC family protein [Brevibacterium casei]QQB15209.1 SRPBCC family protein [Brevibacterium casei]